MPLELPSDVKVFLTGDPRLERCPPDVSYAHLTVDRILTEECEDAMHAAAQGRWRKANTYSYDGSRKALEAWLLAWGWRIRAAPGAHAAAVEVARIWLTAEAPPGPRIASSFSASRKARHDDEYPSPRAMERTDRELRALVLDNARLINRLRQVFRLEPAENIVPTEEVLAGRPER